MLYEVMKHIRNFFPVKNFTGTFSVSNGQISLPDDFSGKYFLIEGSLFNDGVYSIGDSTLTDETFNGCVTSLAPPKAFLSLVDEIEAWQEKRGADALKPFQSESFGGYSYTRATNANGQSVSWQDAFGARLNAWRKI